MRHDWDNPPPYNRRQYGRRRSGAHGLVTGAAIILVGVLMLLNNLGILEIHDIWRLWPLILIGLGISKLIEGAGPMRGIWAGTVMIVVGVLFLLDNFHIVPIRPGLIVPIILIALGLMFLIRSFGPRSLCSPAAPVTGISLESSLDVWAVFSAVKRRIESQSFTGGEILAVFGGVNIDLRRAAIQGDQAVIEANATFGGIELRVPDTWAVSVRGMGLFGGYQDETAQPPSNPGAEPAKRLIVAGRAVFGGVEIRN
jgi:predicted membrane protein